jgi:hypothetical protein
MELFVRLLAWFMVCASLYVPLKCGSPSSTRCRFLFPSSCRAAAAARFSIANRSRPKLDVRGVGGSKGFAGLRKVCCWCAVSESYSPEFSRLTMSFRTSPPCLTGSGSRTSVSCAWSSIVSVSDATLDFWQLDFLWKARGTAKCDYIICIAD